MISYSDEQISIIKSVSDGYSVVVDAVAGSGKTTTILGIIQSNPESIFVVLTYNSKLKLEVREKISSLNITNAEIHSYHSFCVKYYNPLAFTDKELIKSFNLRPIKTFSPTVLILDESQDLTPTLYEFVIKILSDASKKPNSIVLLGDKNQTIYQFNGSTPLYLTEASEIFSYEKIVEKGSIMDKTQTWKIHNLSTSYRITDKMEEFINYVLLKHKRMKSIKKTKSPVLYVFSEPYETRKNYEVLSVFNDLLKQYKYTDFMILAPSVRIKKEGKQNPISYFANKLSDLGIKLYIPNSDQEKVDSSFFEGKLPFMSFHQSKGLEASVVFIFNFDESYFEYYNKNDPTDRCPNALYVACTRAKEQLVLVHSSNKSFLPFIDENVLYHHVKIVGSKGKNKKTKEEYTKPNTIAVNDLVRHIPTTLSRRFEELFTVTINEKKSKKILKIPFKIKCSSTIEDVSDINGTALAAYYEYHVNNGKMKILETLVNAGKAIESSDLTVPELLTYANQYNAYMSYYNFKLNQITNYSYLGNERVSDSEILQEVLDRFNSSIPKPYCFEYQIRALNEDLNIELCGTIDCFSGTSIFEIKCVSSVRLEHYLQVICYKWIITKMQETLKKEYKLEDKMPQNIKKFVSTPFMIKLFNVIEDTEHHITISQDNIDEIVNTLLYNYKYGVLYESLESFLESCNKIRQKYTKSVKENEEIKEENEENKKNIEDDFQ